MAAEFVHLHVHSQYSFLTSAVKLSDLPGKAKALGMRGVGLTDVANMYGAIRHYKGCKDKGLTPILGCEVFVPRTNRTGALDHLVLLAENHEGYKNLVRIVSEGHLRSAHDYAPAVTLDFITERNKGIVALSGCMAGVVAQRILEGGVDRAEPTLAEFRDRFEPGHFFVELQDHGFPEQPVLSDVLLKASGRLNLPVIASNDVHFMTKDDGIAQLYLECVGKGRTFAEEQPLHHNSFEMYLKTPDEMAALFGGIPGALENTLLVTEMCSALKLELGKPMLPQFPLPEGYDTDTYFRHVSAEGLEKRLAHFRTLGKKVNETEYRERLEIELNVIIGMKYPGYFLIVWDFIREAKVRGIPVGPGRGSGAGSIVAYSLEITEIDPIPYALLFERFLNPERVSMPDFDVDFCMSRRDEVIRYVAEKYGVDSVGQIATFQNL
ncbi:MAG TPA: DNA polymerase III subunit alpha, partial [Polyangiaceae bacterium]|nr:DNA polymerase III subunit alpha [Polyangiaceae bacterium]